MLINHKRMNRNQLREYLAMLVDENFPVTIPTRQAIRKELQSRTWNWFATPGAINPKR